MEILKFEWRANIKFMVKLDWDSLAICDTLAKVYQTNAPSRATVFRWIKKFKDGQESLKDAERRGRPATSVNGENSAAVQAVVEKDRRASIHTIANDVGLPYTSVQKILTDQLGLSKLSARWVKKRWNQFTKICGCNMQLTF